MPMMAAFLVASAMMVPDPLAERGQPEVHLSSSDWHIHVVENESDYIWSSLALDSMGYPHICYLEWYNTSLTYAAWTGSTWMIETIDNVGRTNPWNSIAVDSEDHPHVAYYDRTDHDLKYAHRIGTNWSIETVDSEGDVGWRASLALDASDRPHISYHDITNEDLKYSTWTGSNWSIEIVDSHIRHPSISIAVDSKGYPHIGYYDGRHPIYDLKYAMWTGANWSLETVDSEGYVGSDVSIALDANDHPGLSYGDRTKGLKFAKWTGLNWTIEVVDSQGSAWGTSLAFDDQDDPHIAYFVKANFFLWYAEWNGSSWMIEVVDSVGDLGDMASLALDDDGNPHISYNDDVVFDQKYATKADIMPPGPEDRSVSLDIDPDTLNLKSKGRWITAYLSAENASVHDIDVSTILLQDALAPERWDYQDDVLMLKFDRQDFKDTVQAGDSVQVKITGKWEDGSAFEAYDTIRVIEPGK